MPLPSFLTQTGPNEYEMYVDNHLLSCYSVCPRLFYYKHILNLRRKGGMAFYPAYGIWWHKMMESFYDHLQEGFDVEQLFVMAAKLWEMDDMNSYEEKDKKRFEKMVGSYGMIPVGGQFTTPVSALTMVNQYYDQYYEQDRQNYHVVSVESGFGHEKEVYLGPIFVDGFIVHVYYTGRPDLVVMDRQERIFPIDHKSTDKIKSSQDNQYKPHSETAGYIYAISTILGKTVDRCIIGLAAREIPAVDKETKLVKPRFKRLHPFYSPEEIQEWKRNAIIKATEIAKLSLRGETFWRMSETQCFQWGRECDFHSVDRIKPSSRETAIQSNYVISDPWSPYKKPTEGGEDE